MNAKRVNCAADVILAAITQNRTAAGIAMALESAQLLMSPEIAAELEQLRQRVAELEMQVSTARAMHPKYPDSEHCQYDDAHWPCPTLTALGETGGAS